MNDTATDNAEANKAVQFDREGDVAVLTLSHAPHNLVGVELGLALKVRSWLGDEQGLPRYHLPEQAAPFFRWCRSYDL